MKKKLSNLSLNKTSVSNLDLLASVGGKLAGSGVDCVTQVGSCQTTSCVCTDNPLVCAPSYDGTCGSGQMMCIPPAK